MDAWQWVLVYALSLVVVQVFVYLYLRGDDRERSFELSEESERGQGTPPTAAPSQPYAPPSQHTPSGESHRSSDVNHAVSPEEEAIVCRHCGARNEREGIYTYCRSCTAQLGV